MKSFGEEITTKCLSGKVLAQKTMGNDINKLLFTRLEGYCQGDIDPGVLSWGILPGGTLTGGGYCPGGILPKGY